MDKLQWLKERQKSIGGSDIGAIMGVNKWKSAFQVYLEKTEDITEVPEATETAYWGNNFKVRVSKEFITPVFKLGSKAYVQLALKTGLYKTLNVIEVYNGQLKYWDPVTEKQITYVPELNEEALLYKPLLKDEDVLSLIPQEVI